MSKTVLTPRSCRSPKVVQRAAAARGCTTRAGKGDHRVITAPNGRTMPYCDRPMGTGLAHKIYRFLISIAVVAFLLVLILSHLTGGW